MRFGVVVFPGSNCDYDCYYVLKNVLNKEVDFIWHKGENLGGYDCVVLPGGFSYGDYLRTGAIARFSPIMKVVEKYAGEGGLVLGICNGFQILLEAGLLPGAMVINKNLNFICRFVNIRVENSRIPYTCLCEQGQVLRIPIAHIEGNYYAEEETIGSLRDNNQIVFRYCDEKGKVSEESNPNGSKNAIAAICSREGNVLGMMPHPERASELILGSEDGRLIFESVLRKIEDKFESGE